MTELEGVQEMLDVSLNKQIKMHKNIMELQTMLVMAYDIFMARIDKLMDAKAGTPELEELKTLIDFVEEYEENWLHD